MLAVPLQTPELTEAMKTRTLAGFGSAWPSCGSARPPQAELEGGGRLAAVIAYYETESEHRPGRCWSIGPALRVAGCAPRLKAVKDGTSPRTARLLKRLRKVEEHPAADRRAVLKLVDALVETRRRAGR
jgi:hypothetical protein